MSSAKQQQPAGMETKPANRKPLPGVRIILVILGLVMALVAVWGLANIHAISTYNEATRSLNTSIAEANRSDADPDRIKAIQDQTDKLFHQAESLGPILLPGTRQAIHKSKAVSDKLTRRVTRQIRSQEVAKGKEGQAADLQEQNGRGQQGLTQEQQDKVDEILRQNQQVQDPSTGPQTSQGKEDPKTVKPW